MCVYRDHSHESKPLMSISDESTYRASGRVPKLLVSSSRASTYVIIGCDHSHASSAPLPSISDESTHLVSELNSRHQRHADVGHPGFQPGHAGNPERGSKEMNLLPAPLRK
uniref:Uncharacterized protein n=1 Tax=Haptolina brevifila TaxID=156173 RepID=A0A6U7CG90_9EUKA|mmetsp:Transcript_16885/g.34086  ORF Transcript_16885/g.34086 Transcript_16885/m.34086 type:complete len:111 (+) Transcript_16885:608-940(+)